MEWKDRKLYGECREKGEHEKELCRIAHRRPQKGVVAEGILSGRPAVDEKQGEYGDQHEKASRLSEHEELHGGVAPVLMAPEGDEEKHGDEHQLPEEIEKKEVDCEKRPCYTGERKHEGEMEKADPVLDLCPRRYHGARAEKKSERHEDKAESVHCEMEAYPELGYPRHFDLDKPAASCRV